MKKFLLYLLVSITVFLVANYFTSCNIVNRHKSVVKENLDSTHVVSKDSAHVVSKDSTATGLAIKTDSSGEHHKKDKQIQINFDTATNYGNGSSYDYSIGGNIIKSPQKIKSAVINDISEDDASTTHKELKQDSLQVKLLDSNIHSSYDSIKDLKSSKTIEKGKESKRTSPLFIGGIILLIIIAGYIIGKRIGFFK